MPAATGSARPFDADTRIDQYLKDEGLWADIDFDDLIDRWEHVFGFQCADSEWNRLFRFDLSSPEEWEAEVGPRFTFGNLAKFIAEHAPPISLAPVALLGVPCETGGVFRGMEQVAQRMRVPEFGPSTPIRDRFRGGRLHAFWNQVRWTSENKLPPLRETVVTAEQLAWLIGFLAVLIGAIATGILQTGIYLEVGIALFAILLVVSRTISYFSNPLPLGVETFADMARLIAKELAGG